MELSGINSENTVLLLCDIQKDCRRPPQHPILKYQSVDLGNVTKRALEFSKIMKIPILKSELIFKKGLVNSKGKPLPSHGQTRLDIQMFFDRNQESIRAKQFQKIGFSITQVLERIGTVRDE